MEDGFIDLVGYCLKGGHIMEQERYKVLPRMACFEDFIILRNSDYWPCLTPQIQKDILSLLDEHRDVYGEDQ